MNRAHKKQQMLRRARATVKGLVIRWTDPDPLAEQAAPIRGEATHRNPVRRLAAQELYSRHVDWITTGQPFRWLVTLTAVFVYPNGVEQRETRELEARARMIDLNEHALEQIQDALRHGKADAYRHTEFTIECLGE